MDDKTERGRHRNGRLTGFRNPRAKLTPEQLAEVIAGFKRGLNNTQIAASLPIGHSMVSRIRLGLSYPAEAKALGWAAEIDRLSLPTGMVGKGR
jgi:hypothetical protein